MAIQFSNLASTTLASGVSSSATSVSVTSASSFPSLGSGDYFYATIGAGSGSEIVKVTAISGTTFTVVRGEDGTTAVSHSSGADCALRVTAGTLEDLRDGGQVYTAGSGLGLSGNEFTNTAPDQTVSLTGAGTTSVSGTYPNFTITGAGTTYTAGSGLSLNGTEFANTAPDQTVALTGAGATSISGTYPNFTITSTDTVYTLPAGYATETYVGTAISNLVDSSPAALDTLNELAAALGDDPNFATTVSTSIGTKLPLAGGTLTGALSGTTATFSGSVTAPSIRSSSGDFHVNRSSDGASAIRVDADGVVVIPSNYFYVPASQGSYFSSAVRFRGTIHNDTGTDVTIGDTLNVTLGIKLNGTTVIDSSRNLTNIGTLNGGTPWTSSNDGSGSGLDADLLDGSNSGAFLKSGAGDSVSGWWISQARNGSSGSPRVYFSNSSGFGQHINTYNTSGSVYALELHNNVKQLFGVYNDGAVLANGGNVVWHAGNDGSGSGLDADLLDGQQGSSYLRSDIPSTISVASSSADLFRLANSTSGQFIQIGFQQNDTDGMHHRAYLKAWKGSGSASGNVDLIVRGSGGSLTSDVLSFRSGNASPTWRGQAIWNAANDGSGSGLDADLLDGLHASSLVRSDAADTMSGTYTFSGGHGAINITHSSILSSAASNWTGDPGTSGKIQYHSNRWYIVGDSSSNRIVQFRRNNVDTSYIDNSGALIGGGNWYSGNDGSGSGLDADLLDGINSTSFLRSDVEATQSSSLIIAANWSAGSYNSQFVIQGTHPSWETRGNSGQPYGWLHHQDASGNYTLYSIAGYTGTSWTQRYTFNKDGTFRNGGLTGNIYYHQGNDGSGSGVDADLLDGMDSQLFNRGDNNFGVMVGTSGWNMNDLFTTRNRAGFFDVWNGSNFPPSTTHVHGMQVRHNSAAHYGWQLAGQYGQNSLWHRQVSNNSWGAWNQQWSSGNDGSGSGLDADLFDGRDSAHYVFGTAGRGTTSAGFASLTNASSGFYDVHNSGTPTGTWYSLMNMSHHGGNHGHQIAGSFYSAGDIYNRNNNNTSLSAWAKIWNTANDGSGSGLDADTVDGVQGASFLRSDATDYQENTIYQRGYLVNETGYRNRGVYGNYDSTKTNHIWSMGIAYQNHSAGSNFGNLYGLAYKHTNNPTGGNLADGHMMVWCQNGNPCVALGTNIWTSGIVKAASFLYNSDRAFKTNIKPIKNALSTVLSLSGVSYTLKKSGKNTTGFIAQEVEKVLPDMVDGDEGEKGVNYGQMVALLTEAMREQQNLIVSLQKEIQELKDATK